MEVRCGLAEPAADQLIRGARRLPGLLSSRQFLGITGFAAKAFGGPGGAPQPWSALRVDVSGTYGGSPRTVTYGLADQLPNVLAAPLAVAALELMKSAPAQSGVVSPEAIFDPPRFFRALAERGVRLATLEKGPPADGLADDVAKPA